MSPFHFSGRLEGSGTGTLTIDPSSDGTTGYFLTDGKDQKFLEIKTTVFNQQLTNLYELVREHQPTNIVYEDIQYINNVGSNTGSLFKLFGAIESLRFAFTFIKQIKSVYSVRIKALRKRILHHKERIDGIVFKTGLG